jgi:hypothetical protein
LSLLKSRRKNEPKDKFEELKKEVVFSCRFHPTDYWHEVDCPHIDWTKEQLIDALRGAKVVNDILAKKLLEKDCYE